MTYDNQDPYSQYDPSGLTPQELLARIESVKTRIASTVTQLGVAESKITQQADEIDLRVMKDGIIAAINLSPETATIHASNINLVGAVTVLSDITGSLGTITAGNIYGVNIYGGYINSETTIDIGSNLRIGINSNGGGYFDNSTINFGNYASITGYNNGGVTELQFNAITLKNIYGEVLASMSDIPSLVGYATQEWVTANFAPKA